MSPTSASPRNLLLTGVPGVGKTTVVRRLAEELAGMRCGGFFTEELREAGTRRGFRLVSFDGRERLIAHVDLPKRCRVGKYGVDVAAIDAAAVELLGPRPGLDLFLVDEIGKMECLSAAFVGTVRGLLDSDGPVIATVGTRGAGFPAEVKQRTDCLLWEITHGNRDGMPDRVLAWLKTTNP